MLREEKNIRQTQGEPPRRWFADEFFDLIVWFVPPACSASGGLSATEADGSIDGFQLCYDREGHPRALTWTRSAGYTHNAIDDGDFPSGAHKSSPVLVSDGVFDTKNIYDRFEQAAGLLPEEIRSIVGKKIKEFPDAKKI
ncbi:MAG: hypothetical protein NTX59_09780 [Elusimicrobia bacterium]|nr:hypothetical protein [Elusimicrobiota bacterium]